MKSRFFAGFTLMTCVASLLACSAGGDGNDSTVGSGNASSGGSSSIPNPSGSSGTLNVTVGGNQSTVRDPNDPREVPVRQQICDAAGKCTCLRLALLGTLESAATAKDTQPFIDWLNGNSDGTATVTLVATKPTLDATFLAGYDILVVANVNSWTFSAEEKAAVEEWVRVSGGGIITLTGFVSQPAEVTASNQLTAFAGIGYENVATAPASGESSPVYYKGGTANLKNCFNLWSAEQDKQAAITTPIKFTPQTGSLEKLTTSLDYVGAFIGWGVTAPPGATVVATDPVSGKNIAVAYEVDATGRIFAFGDEWVVFANQWQPSGMPTNTTMDMYNPCWQASDGTNPGFFHSAKSLYQTKQFWYNAINWVAPPNECNFVVDDPDVVVK
jgi:hypothetical protein